MEDPSVLPRITLAPLPKPFLWNRHFLASLSSLPPSQFHLGIPMEPIPTSMVEHVTIFWSCDWLTQLRLWMSLQNRIESQDSFQEGWGTGTVSLWLNLNKEARSTRSYLCPSLDYEGELALEYSQYCPPPRRQVEKWKRSQWLSCWERACLRQTVSGSFRSCEPIDVLPCLGLIEPNLLLLALQTS